MTATLPESLIDAHGVKLVRAAIISHALVGSSA